MEEERIMGVTLGHEMKLYYCAAGIGGTPTWMAVVGAGAAQA